MKMRVKDIEANEQAAGGGHKDTFIQEMREFVGQTIDVSQRPSLKGWYGGKGYNWHKSWLDFEEVDEKKDASFTAIQVLAGERTMAMSRDDAERAAKDKYIIPFIRAIDALYDAKTRADVRAAEYAYREAYSKLLAALTAPSVVKPEKAGGE